MTTLFLMIVCLGQATDNSVSAKLDADFRDLLAKEVDPTPINEAVRLLSSKKYLEALPYCRRARSKAAIPLLLKQMLQCDWHVESELEHYVDTIAILTGEDLTNPWRSGGDNEKLVRLAVEQWTNSWWCLKKAKITTRLDEMSTDQIRVVIGRLLRKIRWSRRNFADLNDWHDRDVGTTYALRMMMSTYAGPPERGSFWPVELDAKMVPVVLERVGYRPDRALEVPTVKPFNFAVVELLAALRQNCGAAELDKIPGDKGQNATCRLTVIWSLHQAGERVPTAPLLSIIASEKSLEPRLVAILALQHSRDRETAGLKLVELLDDRNDEIRTAAVTSLTGPLPTTALPKLKQIVDNLDPPQAMTVVFDLLGRYKQPQSQQILIDFLKAGLEDSQKTTHLSHALRALEDSTGKRWISAGPHEEGYWKEKCQEAIHWWDNRVLPQ
ncbi:MAG: HEAT repeat domain-containing protein [Planctomycetes bacterium]|nr:HEAT repeat domain-containing protein [Planctomycetota bacterium]